MAEYSKCTIDKNTLFNNWLSGKATSNEKDNWYEKLIYFPEDAVDGKKPATLWFFSDKIDENGSNADRLNLIKNLNLEKINELSANGQISIVNKKGVAGFTAQIAVAPLLAANSDLVESSSTAVKAKNPSKPSDSVAKTTKTTTSARIAPSTKNISFEDTKNKVVMYRIGDLRLYTSTAVLVLKDAQKRLDFFGITLDKPINLKYHAESVKNFPEAIKRVLFAASIEYSDNDFIKIAFNKEDYKWQSFTFIKSLSNGTPAENGSEITNKNAKVYGQTFFKDSTTNSIIFNLSRLYNRYNKLISREANVISSQTSIFYSSDTIRIFLNKYIYPRSSIATNEITRDLVEKFIIGDARLLDDDLRKNFFVNSSQLPDALRGNLQREISKQYEKVGDALGDAWISGKFERVDDVDDLFEQLLNYISIPDLISLSAKCLIKLIPLDELLDLMCKPVLKEFDKHKEAIVQALDEMDDGIAKDLAKELKEIYFNRLLNEQLEQNVAQGIVGGGLKKTPGLIQDSETELSWLTKTGVSLFHSNISNNFGLMRDSVDEFKYQPESLGGLKNVKTIPYSGLKQRLETTLERIKTLEEEKSKIDQQISVFSGNIPQNLSDLQSYYSGELSKQRLKRDEIQQGIDNGNRQIKLYELLLNNVFPNLIILDPYLESGEKKELLVSKNYTGFSYSSDVNQKEQDSAKQLNSISIEGVNNGNPVFNFSTVAPLYSSKTLRQKKNDFNFNIQNGLKKLVDEIQRLQSEKNAPFNILNSLEKFGVGVLDGYFFDPKVGIFSDPNKRYYLCLAIYSAVPAVFYGIHLLVENADDVADFFEEQGKTLYEALKQKVLIMGNFDYPFLDILGEFVDSLIQLSINFTRDLIVNGIMWTIRQVASACSDQEKINAPYNPVGAIDLSGYMASSAVKGNPTPAGDTANTEAYKEVVQRDPAMTPGLFDIILSKISEKFSINEIASLLDDTAQDRLYTRALQVLEDLTPQPLSKESAFYQYYANESGIRDFFEIISKSIEPSLIVNLQNDYGKQKEMLLDICFGYDDSVLESLLDGLDEDAIREALAANYASKVETVPLIEEALEKVLGENIIPDPCEAGIQYFTDAERFALKAAFSSVYEGLNNSTQVSVRSSKNAFSNTRQGLTNLGTLSPEYGEDPVEPYSVYTNKENQSIFDGFSNQNRMVGLNNLEELKKLSKQLRLNFTTDENNNQTVSFNYQNLVAKQSIDFSFNSEENKTNFSYSNLRGVKNKDELEPFTDIALYQENNYFAKKQIEKEELEASGPGIFQSDLNLITSPENILFSPFDGIVMKPDYSTALKENIAHILKDTKLRSEDVYYHLLNSIFEDMLYYPFKTGLYLRKNFDKLNLNKLITTDLQQVQGGQLTDKCFLGFMDDAVLTTQTLNLAEKLSCYAKNSPTIAPSNVAALKILFDAFIRNVVLEEMMKSFFVIGIFPKELVFDTISPNSNSIYEQIIKINTVKSVEKYATAQSGGQSYEKFYDEVFRRFVTDVTRIIFRNSDITDVQAFDFIINSQIQFVKNQFRKAYENAFGVNSTTIFGTTEYQLLKEQTSLGDLDETVNESLLSINDEQFTYAEKLRAIQNDGMADFYQGVVDSGKINDSKSFLNSNGTPKLAIEQEKEAILPYGVPLYKMENLDLQEYFNIEEMKFKPTNFLEDLTLGNNKGFVLEKYIEFKPNSTLFSKKLDPEIKETIENFLLKTSALINPVSDETPVKLKQAFTYRKKLKLLLYESKLFMMFPQIIDFIHSLDEVTFGPQYYGGDLPLWTYYYFLRKESKPVISPYSQETEYQVDKVVFDLIYWMFKLNYDTPEEFFSDEKSLEWYEFIKTADNGELFKKINLSLSGKMRLNDFQYLLDKCVYPSYSDVIEGGEVDSPWGYSFVAGAFLSEDDILTEPKNTISHELLSGQSVGQYLNSLFTSNTRIKQFFDFLSFENIYGQINNGNSNGYAGVNPAAVDDLFEFLQEKIKEPQEYFNGLSFFEWFYTRKTYQIININTVLRINAKLPDFDILSGEPKFVLSNELSSKTFNDQMEQGEKDRLQLEMVKEKIGLEEYVSETIGSNYLFSTPMYEIKQRIPSYSWLEFFVAIDKASYFKKQFYDLESNPNNILNLNDFLFSNDKKDLYSYFYKLKAFSDSKQKEVTTIKKSQYFSTFWWNINGKSISLSEILEKVYTAGKINDISIYDILTDESLRSFYEANYLTNQDFVEGGDVSLSSQYTDFEDVKIMGKKLFIKSTSNGGDLLTEEYNAIVKQVLKLASTDSISAVEQDEEIDKDTKKNLLLVKSGLDPQGDFVSGVTPFVEINNNFDWGFPYYDGAKEIFSQKLELAESLGTLPTADMTEAEAREFLDFPEKQAHHDKMEEFIGTLFSPGINFKFKPTPNDSNKNKAPMGCTKDPKTHEDSIRELAFIEEGKGFWAEDLYIEITETSIEYVWEWTAGPMGGFVEKEVTKVVGKTYYTGWIFPKSGYDSVDLGNSDSYYLAVNTTKNGLTFWVGDSGVWNGQWRPGTSRPIKYSPGIPSEDQEEAYDADGTPLQEIYMKLSSNQNSALNSWDKKIKQRYMEVKFGFVKGGLGAETQQILSKELPGQFPNVYDLFASAIKSEEDKELFRDFLNCFFLKEQATIIALLHRILTEQYYPQLGTTFRNAIHYSLSSIRSVVGSLNGDYQTDTKPSDFERIELFLDTAGELGLDFLKSFLKGMASTVDPTWQTPWFLPGPLTPFGVAAKLLDEDLKIEKPKPRLAEKQSPLVCADSLKSSTDFLDEYSKIYQEVLGGKDPNNINNDDNNN